MIVTIVGMGCGGHGGADNERHVTRTAKSCGPDVAVLASNCSGDFTWVPTQAKESFSGESTI